jgi:hypothetical protein
LQTDCGLCICLISSDQFLTAKLKIILPLITNLENVKIMKQVITLFSLLMVVSLSAQKKIVWFDAGLKAQYGAAGLYNKAVSELDKYDYTISSGYGFGGKLGINFGYNGLAIDIMKSSAKQELQNIGGTGLTTINWSSLDVYTLFRNAKNLGYFEIGPKVSFINKVSDDAEGSSIDRTDLYQKNVFSGVVGFGANIMGNEQRFSGILGLRFEYAFTDFVSPAAVNTDTRAPLPNVAGLYSKGYTTSNIAFAGLVFELNWGIGYYGKAQCGQRSKFIMFGR